MPPQVQNLVLTFTHARRSVEAPSTLSLKLATLPAPDQWGVWTRRASVVLMACPMAGRMFSSTTPLYEPGASDFHEFSPSFVNQYVDNFKRGGIVLYEGANPIYFATDDPRFGSPVVSELYVHSKAPPCDMRSLWVSYQAISVGVQANASSASTAEAPRASTPPTLPCLRLPPLRLPPVRPLPRQLPRCLVRRSRPWRGAAALPPSPSARAPAPARRACGQQPAVVLRAACLPPCHRRRHARRRRRTSTDSSMRIFVRF